MRFHLVLCAHRLVARLARRCLRLQCARRLGTRPRSLGLPCLLDGLVLLRPLLTEGPLALLRLGALGLHGRGVVGREPRLLGRGRLLLLSLDHPLQLLHPRRLRRDSLALLLLLAQPNLLAQTLALRAVTQVELRDLDELGQPPPQPPAAHACRLHKVLATALRRRAHPLDELPLPLHRHLPHATPQKDLALAEREGRLAVAG